MTEQEIIDRAGPCFVNLLACKPEALTQTATLTGDLGMDSLDTIELVMALEEEFEIEVTDAEVEAAETVGDVYALIRKNIKE